MSIARKGFDFDLADGEQAEESLAKILRMDSHKIEVKRDHLAAKSTNLYIELTDKGRDSGIRTTEADTWAFEIKPPSGIFILLPTEKLKEWVDRAERVGLIKSGGDDNNPTVGAIVPLDWIVYE